MTRADKPKPKPQPPKPKRKNGRPAIYNPKLADRVCEHIVDGKSLRTIARLKGMPGVTTMMKWCRESAEFASRYARAKEEQAEGYADALLDLARKANRENANAVRVKADIIKWICAKLKPQRFGDRVELRGQIGIEASELTQRERARRIGFALQLGSDIIAQQEQQQQHQPSNALRLPAPVPDPIYRDAVPPDAVRAQHPGGINPPDVSREEDAGRVIDASPERHDPLPGRVNFAEQGLSDWLDEQRR